MARGGRREGAGRPKGAHNKASNERQAKVAAEGVTPLDVLISGMRFHFTMAERLLDEPDGDAKSIAAALEKAGAFASQAAPYVHPRLATVAQSVTHDVSDALADLMTAIDSKTRGVPNAGNGINPTATSH